MSTILAIKISVTALLLASTQPVPHIDIQKTCLNTAGGDGLRRCLDSELEAKRHLVEIWSKIPQSYRDQCILDPLPPNPSYLLLSDCIDNNVILSHRPGH